MSVLEMTVVPSRYIRTSGVCCRTSGLAVNALTQAFQMVTPSTNIPRRKSVTAIITCLGSTESPRNPKTNENCSLLLYLYCSLLIPYYSYVTYDSTKVL